MPGNAFINFGSKVKGESVQSAFKDWIDIGDWSWDIEAESSFLKGGGAAVGKPQPGSLSFSKFYDKSSPNMMTNLVKGVHFDEVILVMCKQTGAHPEPQEYFRATMKKVFMTKVSTKGGEDGAVSQDIEIVFKEVKFEYKFQDDKGKLSPAGEFEWDIAANKVSS